MAKKGNLLLITFILIKFILQYLLVHPVYELHRDEFLHLDQGHHLAWGYHSVPPLTSWISWLIRQLGNGHFWVKFFPALFGALTIAVVWKTIESLKGSRYACLLAATALLCSSLLRMNILYQPNSFDILAWTFLYFSFIRFIQSQQTKWLYIMAISFALGFLNKYNIIFCVAGLLPALLLSPHRRIFTRPQLYIAISLALLLISPNVIWQFQHDLPVLKHMKELQETQLIHVNRVDFLKEQLFFFIGSAFILVGGLVSFFAFPAFRPYRWLFFSYLFTMSLFTWLKAKPYYAIGLYPILFAFGSVYLSRIWEKGRAYSLRYIAMAIILLFCYPLIVIAMPVFSPATYSKIAAQKKPFSEHTWEDGKKYPISQDFADMLGWKELTRKVDSIYQPFHHKRNILILCDNYGQAGAINFYTRINGLTAGSFTDDYINWLDLDRNIETIIRVKEAKNNDLGREKQLFNQVQFAGKIENEYAREKGTQIFVLSNPKTPVAERLKAVRIQLQQQ